MLEIIEKLDSDEIENIENGIISLEDFLADLVPEIAYARNNIDAPQSSNLTKFIEIQSNFQFNLTSYLLGYYKIVNRDISKMNVTIFATCNRLLQGLLLLHRDSRNLFNRDYNMLLILGILALPNEATDSSLEIPIVPIEITVSLISTLIHILLKNLKNFRTFENNNGCSILIQKLQLPSFMQGLSVPSSKQQELNFKIVEFLIFYMFDETDLPTTLPKYTINAKCNLFRPYFPGIDALVENMDDLKRL